MKTDMNNQLNVMLGKKSFHDPKLFIEEEISEFQKKNNFLIPDDMKGYFELLKNTKKHYNDNLYQFYPLLEFKSINEELKYFNGTPDYSNLAYTLKEYEYCFVFADFQTGTAVVTIFFIDDVSWRITALKGGVDCFSLV